MRESVWERTVTENGLSTSDTKRQKAVLPPNFPSFGCSFLHGVHYDGKRRFYMSNQKMISLWFVMMAAPMQTFWLSLLLCEYELILVILLDSTLSLCSRQCHVTCHYPLLSSFDHLSDITESKTCKVRTEHYSLPAWLRKHSFLACVIRFSLSIKAAQRAVASIVTQVQVSFLWAKECIVSLAKLTVLVALIHSVHLPPITSSSFNCTLILLLFFAIHFRCPSKRHI